MLLVFSTVVGYSGGVQVNSARRHGQAARAMTPVTKGAVGNLPADLTSFIGRRGEMAAIKQALTLSRLVTLVGVGGVGKTRLAVHAAAEVRRAFSDGGWFVDLSPLQDEDLVASTIARSL